MNTQRSNLTTRAKQAQEAQRRRDSKWAQASVDKVLARAFDDAAQFWELAYWLGLA